MSDRSLILKAVHLSGNCIPTGRQLPRTPPLFVTKQLDFSNDSSGDHEEPPQDVEQEDSRGQDDRRNTMFEFNPNSDDFRSMLKGMKGYTATPEDLECIRKLKEERTIKELQGELEELQSSLRREKVDFEQMCFCRDAHMAEPKKDVIAWARVVLEMTLPSTDLKGKDGKSLLAMLTPENVQRAVDEKKLELARLEKMLANKKKRKAKERDHLERKIACDQLKVQMLMSQLLDLQSEVAQQEEVHKALQMQIDTQDAPEIKAEEVDASEDLQAAKVQTRSRVKGRTKAVKSEKLQDTTKSKSTRSKHTDDQTGVRDGNKTAAGTLKTEKPPKSAKEARGPQKKDKEATSQVPPGAVQATASQPSHQSHRKSGEAQSTSLPAAPLKGRKKAAVAAGDAGDIGLRRSKRIASKK